MEKEGIKIGFTAEVAKDLQDAANSVSVALVMITFQTTFIKQREAEGYQINQP